ncbi:MAG: DUF4236 domain-containing protein [Dysosmobacter sp.]|nr:DUF4236 domain-containing protein [Dysosmobacter sp.]
MGFRFRKSINLGGDFRINLSKSGVGYSYGGKGFRVTKRADGKTQTTVSIPGTGISYTETTGKKKAKNHTNVQNPTYSNGAASAGQMGTYSKDGMSLGAFVASTTFAIALSVAGIVTMMLWSWWGLALVGVGVGILTIIYNKV